jgi:metallophosphoesterase (TIGR00282 family)
MNIPINVQKTNDTSSIFNMLFCGDIVGKSGRLVLQQYLTTIKERYTVHFTVVNGENAAHGFGITGKIAKELYDMGVDVITTGNHIWDKREIMNFIDHEPRLLRPLNYPENIKVPGRGYYIYTICGDFGKVKVLVMNVMGRLFMDQLDNPMQAIDRLLSQYALKKNVDVILIDFHAEATAEKQIIGFHYDGQVSFVVGTHTHVPTADERILPKGTAYLTDAGMCGDYVSILGVESDIPIYKMRTRLPGKTHFKPSAGEGTLCGVLVKINLRTGLALKCERIICGGSLKENWPNEF